MPLTLTLTAKVWFVVTLAIFVFFVVWAANRESAPKGTTPASEMSQSQQVGPSEPGDAERLTAYLYRGTNIPGWSVPPPVSATERERQIQERRERERPIREAYQQQAARDLARRLGGVPVEDITLQSWSERTWLFSGLGCNPAGAVVAPANTPGWIFVFRYAGSPGLAYTYHSDRVGKGIRYCQTIRETVAQI